MPIVLPSVIEGLSSGSDEFALPGSGRSIIGGVESYYVYGDLILNDRKKVDTYIIKEIDGMADPDIRDAREVIPQGHGEHVFTSWYGGRTMVLSGTIRAHNIGKLRDMQEALKGSFTSLVEKPLRIVSPYKTAPHHSIAGELEAPEVQIFCKKSQPIQMREAQQNFQFTRDFQLTLRASSPYFLSSYPEVFSDTSITSPLNFDLTNKGNYRAYPQIVLTGPINTVTLTNNVNNEAIILAVAIPSGEVWTIDTGNRTFVDQDGNNKFAALDVNSNWPGIEPGTNDFTLEFSGESSATAIAFSFNHTWI